MSNANWEHAHVYMDDAGTVIASSDLSSQVVDLTAGGGSQPSNQTATVTTDAGTFLVQHDFDLERIALAQYTFTVTALIADGETFGAGAGEIGVGFSSAAQVSIDGITWANITAALLPASLSEISSSGYAIAVDQFEIVGAVTPRYLRIFVGIFDNDTSDIYAGANNPTATVRLDVDYL